MTALSSDPKAALRTELRVRRTALKHDHPDAPVQAALAFERAGLGLFGVAAIYHPLGSEFDPFPLAAVLVRQGCRIALPAVVARDAALVFRLGSEEGPLPPDALGVPAPGPGASAVRPDLVICPLLGFDRRGRRLGQGGGFYDRTLAELRAAGPVVAIGLAYAGQELPEVPTGPFDQRLDGVLTEAGWRPAETDAT
ncbi:MAG TPA: 5-formyltetrahydrofolate cyclo-ligase [Caulobacteraceae bacterium]|jgi:5-formyltetrahydrofolate cyclo-ligase|nr:5-formyltetrahydrofolate cyclo-ligase [Caulobacteraceae bacterium]